jgi:cobalt-zinc-cadmium efflux system membrane fusion protein
MKNKKNIIFKLGWTLAVILIAFVASDCGGKGDSGAKAGPPANIENAVKESDLTTITLSPEAEKRLGITTEKVEVRRVARTLRLGGDIIALPGHEANVAAPAAGVVLAPSGQAFPLAGAKVKKGQAIVRLMLLPPEKEIIGAREEVEVRQKQFEVAQAKARRTAQLFADKAASEKASQEAQAELAMAEAALNSAKAKLQLLTNTNLDSAAENLTTLGFASPVDGVLEGVFVASGQNVPASTPLFEVASLHPVWVRVPVYVGDLAGIDLSEPARIEAFGSAPGSAPRLAKPVEGPPLSHADAMTSDLYFELSNPDSVFRIDQKVGVTLALRAVEDGLTAPFGAVLYDAHGGTWLYVRSGTNAYTRRRVEVHHIVDNIAVITRGLTAGAEVVVAGAAELFGTEFGVGK